MLPLSRAKVLNLRLRGVLPGEGSFNLQKLYYLSVHSLDGTDGTKYGKSRVCRELLDAWLEKKISYGGIFFTDAEESLTEEDSRS